MAEEPPPSFPPPAQRLAAVWFADIVGYTRLCSENQTTALWQARLLQTIAREASTSSGGRVVKRIGDAVLAEFPSTHAAVLAALRLQDRFQDQTRTAGAEATLRVGIHVGDIVLDEGDVFGDGVNLASRIQGIADPGRVMVSEDVWRQLRGNAEFRFRALGNQQLAGVTIRMSVFDVELSEVRDDATSSIGARSPRSGHPMQPGGATGAACPYLGLRAFSEDDAPLYFGRETFARELFEKVHQRNLVAVVSASGSGKSSLIQAGVLPLLRRQLPGEASWDALVFTPGGRPFHSLAAALVDSWMGESSTAERLREAERLGNDCAAGVVSLSAAIAAGLRDHSAKKVDRLLLVVDQFEELFTQTREESVREMFATELLAAADTQPLNLVLTLRADFYGQAIGVTRGLSDAIQRGLVNLGPMTREELTRAIVEPATVVGLQFEPGLVERILDDVIGQSGRLPLLEFALTELWSRRQGWILTHAGYEAIGRVDGAIGRRADRELSRWSPDEQQRLVRELTRLVHIAAPQEEGADTRLRETMSVLDSGVQNMVRSFADARLLVMDRSDTTGRETVEVAHEALIRSWPRLRDALDADRAFLLWRQRLKHRIAEWNQLGGSTDLLLKGPLLTEARSYARGRDQHLNAEESDFIRRSSRSASSRRKLTLASGAAVGILLLAAVGGWGATRTDRYQIGRLITAGNRIVAVAEDSTAAGWFAALIDAGRSDLAISGAQTIDDAPRRSRALARLADELMDAALPAEAERVSMEAAHLARAQASRAREVNDPERRAFEFEEALVTLWESGEVEEAVSVAREAFSWAEAIDARERRQGVMQQLAGAFAQVGQLQLALSAARQSGDGEDSFYTLVTIAARLMSTGQVPEGLSVLSSVDSLRQGEALESALFNRRYVGPAGLDTPSARAMLEAIRQMKEPPADMALFAVGPELIEAGAAGEVLLAVRAIEDSASRTTTLRSLVPTLAATGHLDEAKLIVNAQDLPRDRVRGQARVALELARRGAAQEALALVPEVLEVARSEPNPAAAAFLLAHLVETYELAGQLSNAEAVAALADSAAQRIREEISRSNTTREIAKRYATLGHLQRARAVADRPYVSDNDRLDAYTTILQEYAGGDSARRQRPGPVTGMAAMSRGCGERFAAVERLVGPHRYSGDASECRAVDVSQWSPAPDEKAEDSLAAPRTAPGGSNP